MRRAVTPAARAFLACAVIAATAATAVAYSSTATATVPATVTPAAAASGTSFEVTGAGATFDSALPPSSVATYKWTPGGQSVQEWLTSTVGTSLDQRVAPRPAIAVGAGQNPSGLTIQLDPGKTRQTMDGFGAAMTDSAATLIYNSPSRNRIMSDLFGANGARFNFVRVPMGATDLISSSYASYDDSALPDPALSKFSIAHDTQHIIPVLQQAESMRPGLKLLATPWSAPAWMKYGGTFVGSCYNNGLNSADYTAYANYFVKFVKAYAARGLPISLVSLQNEPEHCDSSYPTMNMTAPQEAQLAVNLRSALNRAGEGDTGILAWDHNWYDEGAKPGAAPTTYPQNVLAAAGSSVAAIGYHCYNSDGNPNAFDTQVQTAPVYMTECSGFLNQANSAANLVWEVHNALIGPIRNAARGSLYWSLALGTDGGPHAGGCGVCRGMISIDRSTGAFAPSEDYYYWEQFSKFVDPGAARIDSTQQGTIETVAFRNPDGSIVLVALNTASSSDYRGHIVQWSGDTKAQKTAWLVGPDGHRRWISDIATYNCLKANGAPGPDVLSSSQLDQLPDLNGVWAVCGVDRIGVDSMLQQGFYARSANGAYTLRLTGANLTLTNSSGAAVWSTGRGGNQLILQRDGNLVEYSNTGPVWASNTVGSGATWFVVGNDGKLALYNTVGAYVWTSEGIPSGYFGHIVQWSGDTNTQKTAWLVGPDGNRRWISDIATYNCLKANGAPGPDVLTSWELNQLPDLNGVWAVCGADRIGVNSMLQRGFYARSSNGSYTLRLIGSNLTLTDSSGAVLWSTGHGGNQLILQGDGNLVEYSSAGPVWASNTVGSGSAWFVVGNDGKLAIYDAAGNYVWTSEGSPSRYIGHIVQWSGDTNAQKTAWLVGPDGHRRWISDIATYNCLKANGAPGPDVLTSWELNQLPDLNGVWATCP